MTRALIVGCGYSGERLAGRLLGMGVGVVGTTRDADRAAELERAGIEPLIGRLDDQDTLDRMGELGPRLVAYFVPPPGNDDPLLAGVLEATMRAPLEAFLYASSTSVYGDREGGWVEETTRLRPEASAAGRQAAERVTLAAAREGMPTRVCRITGIYGPGRSLRGALEAGRYVLIEGLDSWVSRIHVDDLVTGLIAAWQGGEAGRVYNMVDDEPHRASEYARLAARLHGLPEPETISEMEARERLSESRLRRKLSNKRVRSVRLKEELGVTLAYPSYRVGLPAAVKAERAGGQAV